MLRSLTVHTPLFVPSLPTFRLTSTNQPGVHRYQPTSHPTTSHLPPHTSHIEDPPISPYALLLRFLMPRTPEHIATKSPTNKPQPPNHEKRLMHHVHNTTPHQPHISPQTPREDRNAHILPQYMPQATGRGLRITGYRPPT